MLLLVLLFGFAGYEWFAVAPAPDVIQAPVAPPVAAASTLPESLVEFMGGHGCTFTPTRDLATREAGFDPFEIDRLIETSLANGTARNEGGYIVLAPEICTIRLPDIQSEFTVDHPFIRSITSEFDHYDALYRDEELYEGEDRFGCFLLDAANAFDERAGGARGAGYEDYIDFLATTLMSGDVRFYSPSPLSTPYSFQVMRGDGCDSVPNAAAVAVSHPYLVSEFGRYVRELGAGTSCDDGPDFVSPSMISAQIQGAEMGQDAEPNPDVNAWLWFEWDLITMAAGWHEGMSGTERGTPRPPLCHYAD